jgi:uncharacterized tellurite resistance protein B-like protein
MDTLSFDKLLLNTAFCCIACDGDIDKREIKLIKELDRERKIFGDINIESELDLLLVKINHDGHKFLRSYFNQLTSFSLTTEEEIKIIEVAISTIKADQQIDYSEIKFFKVIRSKLKIENEQILKIHPDFEEYLEQDIISESYINRLQENFFDTNDFPSIKLNL